MTNDDLKRFYDVNGQPNRNKDFVRYEANGAIISKHEANQNDELVNYQTLIKHAGGAGADINYREAWVSGSEVHQYDVMYVDINLDRCFYMATSDIASSTTAPNVDTQHWIPFLSVKLPRQLSTMPEASSVFDEEIVQFVGTTDASYTNGYFYKCGHSSYYIVVGSDESTYYCKTMPTLGGDPVQLYTDDECTVEATGKTVKHITTGDYIATEDEVDEVECEITEAYHYGWSQVNAQPEGLTNPMTAANDLIIGGTNGAATRLAKGTANQVLGMNSDGTAIGWQNPSGGTTLYRHSMTMTFSSSAISTSLSPGIVFELICSRETKFNTFAEYVTYVKANGPLRVIATGYVTASSKGSLCQSMRILTSAGYDTKVEFYIGKVDSTLTADNVYADHTTDTFNLTDTVTPV